MRHTEISKRLTSTAEQRAAKLVPPVALERPAEQGRKEIAPVERAQDPPQNQVAELAQEPQQNQAAELEQDRNPAEAQEPNRLVEPARDRKPAEAPEPQRNRPGGAAPERKPAAAEAPTKWAAIKFHRAVAAVRSVEEAAALLPKQLVAGVAPVWVAVAREEAAAAAAEEVVAAVAAAAVGDASDEQCGHGTKTYEIEIKHHESAKNLFPRVCHRYVTGICIAGRAGS
jgi:hypothetical protein